MKKYKVVLFACVLMLLLSFGVAVNAAKIGDVTGKVVYSDISAYINHAPIPSYVIDGVGTVIVAEDLKDYGCDVVWKGYERALYVDRNADKKFVQREVFKSCLPIGTKFADLLYTDIKVYVNGILVPSYAINGYTMITMEDFGRCMDGFTWAQDIRAAKAWMDSHPIQAYEPLKAQRVYHLFHDEFFDRPRAVQGYFDFNCDGKEEYYKVQQSYRNYGYDVFVTVGNAKNQYYSSYPGLSIMDVFAVNLDGGNNFSLAVFFSTNSGEGCHLTMWNYKNGKLLPCDFGVRGGYVTNEYHAYPDYLDVNDDNSITLHHGSRLGNWSIYRKFALIGGIYIEVVPELYPIPLNYAETFYSYKHAVSATDIDMMKKGFIQAAASYQYGDFYIKQGEYIRLVYEKEGAIYVEKTNGTGAWIYVNCDEYGWPLNLKFIPDCYFMGD